MKALEGDADAAKGIDELMAAVFSGLAMAVAAPFIHRVLPRAICGCLR